MNCIRCGETFTKVGQHYRLSSCDYPELSNNQKEILTGVLMGDGSISDDGNERLRFVVEMKNEPFLQWLHKQIPEFSTGVKKKSKGTYYISTIRCPEFRKMYDNWYDGDKKFPESVELTPTVLRMWYVTDGHLKQTSGRPMMTIGCKNEFDRKEFLSDLIEFADPSFYSNGLWLSVDETERAFEYMGTSPVSGFDYKWENINV